MATFSRLLKIIGLFCKRTLQRRLCSAKETYNFVQGRVWESLEYPTIEISDCLGESSEYADTCGNMLTCVVIWCAVACGGADFFWRVDWGFRSKMRVLRPWIRVLDIFGRMFENYGRILEESYREIWLVIYQHTIESVLQCVAVWCSALQCVAVCCSVLQCVADTARVISTQTNKTFVRLTNVPEVHMYSI